MLHLMRLKNSLNTRTRLMLLLRQRAFILAVEKSAMQPGFEPLIKREKRVLQRLQEVDHIPRLLDNESDHLRYRYIRGDPLYRRYPSIRQLPLNTRLEIFVRVLEIVEHVHKRNIVHNDLSPGNVVLCRDQQPAIIDFGNATDLSTDYWIAHGKPHYASPEQIRGEVPAITNDIYQLGCLMHELVYLKQYQDHNNKPYTDIGYYPNTPINEILCAALTQDPTKRFTECSSFAYAVRTEYADEAAYPT